MNTNQHTDLDGTLDGAMNKCSEFVNMHQVFQIALDKEYVDFML